MEVGKKYKAVGTCGMSEGKEIVGVLLNYTLANEPILQDEKGQLHSVNKSTMVEVKNK